MISSVEFFREFMDHSFFWRIPTMTIFKCDLRVLYVYIVFTDSDERVIQPCFNYKNNIHLNVKSNSYARSFVFKVVLNGT